MYGKLDYAMMTLNKCSVVFHSDTIFCCSFLFRHDRQQEKNISGSNMRDYEFILNLETSEAHGARMEQVHYREFCVVLFW